MKKADRFTKWEYQEKKEQAFVSGRQMVVMDFSEERLGKGKDIDPRAKNWSYEQPPRNPS